MSSINYSTNLSDAERERILHEFNKPALDNPLYGRRVAELFREQVKKTPNAVAVQYESNTLTYSELDSLSDRVAATLVEGGVSANEIVALQLSRSLSLAVGILGVTKSGAAFLPMDPSWPLERRQFVVKDARVNFLISQEKFSEEMESWFEGTFLAIDTIDRGHDQSVRAFLESQPKLTDPDDLAYVIFTR